MADTCVDNDKSEPCSDVTEKCSEELTKNDQSTTAFKEPQIQEQQPNDEKTASPQGDLCALVNDHENASMQEQADKDVAEDKENVAEKTASESTSPKESKQKGSSPGMQKDKAKEELTDKQRKAKIEQLRKKKIDDYKKKEEDRRKAVLERKKKLEEEEKARHEALAKKLGAGRTTPPRRPASAPARRAVSFSSLSHLQRTHVVAHDIDIDDASKPAQKMKEPNHKSPQEKTDAGKTRPTRPSSAMERKRPLSFSRDAQSRPNTTRTSTDAASKPGQRPKTAMSQQTEPKMRHSISNLPPRPSSAAAQRSHPKSSEERIKALATPKSRPSMPPLPTKPLVPATKSREMQKSKSLGNIGKASLSRPKGPIQPGKKTAEPQNGKQKVDAKPITATKNKAETEKPKMPNKPKEAAAHGSGKHEPSHENSKKAGPSNEAEAKKLLAEKRRQVKEEAERKRLVDMEKAEEERIKREEEQKQRAEELAKEQERQKLHLEQLRKEAEDRERREQEEKERKEQEERELIEAQKKLRQEDIDRRAQEEVDRRAKEREVKRQQEEADRMERKKRVQEILESRLRGSPGVERPVSPTPMSPPTTEEPSGKTSPPMIDSNDSARDRVQKLLEKKSQMMLNDSQDSAEESNIEETSANADHSNTIGNEDSTGVTATDLAIETVEVKHSNGEQQIDDLLFEPESSLIEADSQALQELEKSRREEVNNGDDKNPEATTNGAINGNALNNNTENDAADNKEAANKKEEDKLWNEAEKMMVDHQDNILNNSLEKSTGNISPVGEENRMWQLVEGRIEMEECF